MSGLDGGPMHVGTRIVWNYRAVRAFGITGVSALILIAAGFYPELDNKTRFWLSMLGTVVLCIALFSHLFVDTEDDVYIQMGVKRKEGEELGRP